MALSVEVGAAEAPFIAQKERRYWLLAVVVILLGGVLRVWGYFDYELWHDEAFWARRIFRSVTSSSMRPLGYMHLSQALMKLHNVEPVLRLPSLVAGIASMPLLLAVCRKVGLSWPVSLLGLFIFAVHPWAVTASKEFKPYALELALHLALLALAASYVRSQRTRDLILLACLGVLSTIFAWSVAMLLPWLFFVLLALTLRARNKRQALIVLAGGTLTAVSLAAIFYLRLAHTGRQRNPDHFGRKYDVFFRGEGWLDHAQWLLKKTADIAAFPARVKPFGDLAPAAQLLLDGLHVAAAIAGCVYLVKQRSPLGLAWLGTWATAIVLGASRVWPYGVFRTNLFLLVYALLLVLCGLQLLADWASRRPATRTVALALAAAYALLFFPYDVPRAAAKTSGGDTASVRKSLETIKAYEQAEPGRTGKRPTLLADSLSNSPFRYYTTDHEVSSESLSKFFTKKVKVSFFGKGSKNLKRKMDRAARKGSGFWLMVSQSTYIEHLESHAKKLCTPDVLMHLPGPALLLHCPRR